MKNGFKLTMMVVVVVLTISAALFACSGPAQPSPAAPSSSKPIETQSPVSRLSGNLPVFYAGSLKAPFTEVNKEFTRLNPDVTISVESGGSAGLVRSVVDGKSCGVLASADYKLIPQLMFPNSADWYVIFGSNQIVLCYTDKSRYQSQINATNWYDILQKDGVTYGRSDPDQDPAGYRTLMVWQLAEKYCKVPDLYNKLQNAKGNSMKPTAAELITLLGSGNLDYAFEYDSVAKQNKLKYVALPDQINLSNKAFEQDYGQASVQIKGSKPGEIVTLKGEPILYAATVPKNFANQSLAIAWVQFLLSDNGVSIMEAAGQAAIKPALASDLSKIPQELRNRVK